MSIKRAVLIIHPMIRNTLLLVPLLFVLLFYFLQEGISIDSLEIGNFKLQGLYLKLDNKLNLKINQIIIPKKHDGESLDDVDKNLEKLKRVLAYFEYIELNSVAYTNDDYRIIYADDTIYVNNSTYEIAGMITPQRGGMVATMPLIYIKKYDLRLNGEVTYGYNSKILTFRGDYSLINLKGKLNMQMQNEKISFKADAQETKEISRVLDLFSIPDSTRSWIDKKVLAKSYRLLNLRGEGTLYKDSFRLNIIKTRAILKLKDVEILFNPKLKPVTSKEVTVRMNGNRLDFDLEEPKYVKKSISGSKISLLNLMDKKHLELLLALKFNTQYDDEIRKILGIYNINIPIKQETGKMRATVNLDIDLKTGKTKTTGRVFLGKGEIKIAGAAIKTYGGEVTFTSNRVALWNIDIFDKWYRGLVNGYVNLSTRKAKLKVDLKSLSIGDKKGISFAIKNKNKLSVLMDFKDRVKFDIPAYKIRIETLIKNGMKISNSDIKPLLPYVKGLPIQLSSGKFTLITKDYKGYDFSGNIVWKKSYLYDRNGYLSNIPFKGKYQRNNVNLTLLDGRVIYNSKKSLVRVNKINVDAKKMITFHAPKVSKSTNKVNIKGKNSVIRYGKQVLMSDNYTLKIRGKNTTFMAIKNGDIIKVEKNGKSLVIHANQIKDNMLAPIINFNGLRGGRYSLELVGNIGAELQGVVDIKGGAIKSFKAYNDLIALFNTVPALMTLSSPGFSSKGYRVRDGKIVFSILEDMVVFNSIYINGRSSTIVGSGDIVIDSGKLNIDIAIRTAREVGKILGSLPLVGYILFGKDKSITTGVKIVGTFKNPKVKVNPIKEALLLPFEFIRRTLTSPAHIINK